MAESPRPGKSGEETSLEIGSREVIISSKIFVGNLNFDTTRSEIENLFGEVGEVVDVFLPTDRDTGRPRGFAFVEFAEGGSVSEAIARFDGYELSGRSLRVNEAEERRPRVGFGGDDGGGGFPGPRRDKGAKPKGSRRNLRRRKRGY